MTYEEIVMGLRSLQERDFDLNNTDAFGNERLYELTQGLLNLHSPERSIPELFAVMERMPDADLGSPGPLVHTLEKLTGYETELVESVRRRPALLSVWMVNRILNSNPQEHIREQYLTLLRDVEQRRDVSKTVRKDAADFVEFQARKGQEGKAMR
jgi:hypothetical protein